MPNNCAQSLVKKCLFYTDFSSSNVTGRLLETKLVELHMPVEPQSIDNEEDKANRF